MFRGRWRRLALLLSLSFGAATCKIEKTDTGDAGEVTASPNAGGAGSTGKAGLGSLCSRICDRSAECSGTVDHGACVSDCRASLLGQQTRLEFYRADYTSQYGDCVTALDCTAFNDVNQTLQCTQRVVASIKPSSAAQALCQARLKCPSSGVTDESCSTEVKLFSDPILMQFQACTSQSCAEQQACAEGVLSQ